MNHAVDTSKIYGVIAKKTAWDSKILTCPPRPDLTSLGLGYADDNTPALFSSSPHYNFMYLVVIYLITNNTVYWTLLVNNGYAVATLRDLIRATLLTKLGGAPNSTAPT